MKKSGSVPPKYLKKKKKIFPLALQIVGVKRKKLKFRTEKDNFLIKHVSAFGPSSCFFTVRHRVLTVNSNKKKILKFHFCSLGGARHTLSTKLSRVLIIFTYRFKLFFPFCLFLVWLKIIFFISFASSDV
jgi:hypothetical protein